MRLAITLECYDWRKTRCIFSLEMSNLLWIYALLRHAHHHSFARVFPTYHMFRDFFVGCYSEVNYVCRSSSNSWYLQKWIKVIEHNNASICNMKYVIPYKRKRLSPFTAEAWYRHFHRVNENNLHCWKEKSKMSMEVCTLT